MADIEFVDGLPLGLDRRRGPTRRLTEIAEALQERPGSWAKVDTRKSPALASTIRKGKNGAFPEGDYEAKAVKVDEKLFDIYARYVGV